MSKQRHVPSAPQLYIECGHTHSAPSPALLLPLGDTKKILIVIEKRGRGRGGGQLL